MSESARSVRQAASCVAGRVALQLAPMPGTPCTCAAVRFCGCVAVHLCSCGPCASVHVPVHFCTCHQRCLLRCPLYVGWALAVAPTKFC